MTAGGLVRRLAGAIRRRRRSLAVNGLLTLSATAVLVVGIVRADALLIVIAAVGLVGSVVWLAPVVRRLLTARAGRAKVARRAPEVEPIERSTARELQSGAIGRRSVEWRRERSLALHDRGYLTLALEVQRTIVAGDHRRSDRVRLERFEGLARFLRGADLPTVAAEPIEPADARRVLHVVKSGYPSTIAGYTLRTHRTAVAQHRAGFDVHVVTHLGLDDGSGVAEYDVDGIRYHRLLGSSPSDLPYDAWFDEHVDALAALVRELRPAVLHAASDFVNARAARIVGNAFGIPVVYEVRGFWEETLRSSLTAMYGWGPDERYRGRRGAVPDTYLWRRRAEEHEYTRVDAVTTLAPTMARRIARAGVSRRSVFVVPNAIDPAEFHTVPRDLELIAELGFRADTAVLGYVSTLNEYEGIDTLIRAFARLRSTTREGGIGLLIVGDGKDRKRLEAVAREVGSAGVVFTGRVDPATVGRHYSVMDIFVVPRTSADVCQLVTPLKPYEALAQGRALVMSDVAALAGIARESRAARLARPGDDRQLARVLRRLLNDDDTRLAMAERGRRWVVSSRTWAANAAAYSDVYAAAAARHRARTGDVRG